MLKNGNMQHEQKFLAPLYINELKSLEYRDHDIFSFFSNSCNGIRRMLLAKSMGGNGSRFYGLSVSGMTSRCT